LPDTLAAGSYPNAYDKIHPSNIPDYTGGTLATFLYALPVLKPGSESSATACCLRNPPRFRNMADFNNEYVGLNDLEDIKKLFPLGKSGYTEGEAGNHLELTQYHSWERSEKSVLGFDELMSRPALETWLYRLFLRSPCLSLLRLRSTRKSHRPSTSPSCSDCVPIFASEAILHTDLLMCSVLSAPEASRLLHGHHDQSH